MQKYAIKFREISTYETAIEAGSLAEAGEIFENLLASGFPEIDRVGLSIELQSITYGKHYDDKKPNLKRNNRTTKPPAVDPQFSD